MSTPTIRIDTSDPPNAHIKDRPPQAKTKLLEFEKKVKLAKKALKHVDAAHRTRIGTSTAPPNAIINRLLKKNRK